MTRLVSVGDAPAPVLLVCLDTLQVAPSRPALAPPEAWAVQAAQLLAHARAAAWPVAHVLRVRPRGGERWRPAPGLAPRPFERVFHRHGPSAFGCEAFAAFARQGAELVLVGRSVEAAFAATAADGLARGLSLAIAADALAAPPRERAELAALARSRGGRWSGALTLQNVARLVAGAPRLRVVEGGRRPVDMQGRAWHGD